MDSQLFAGADQVTVTYLHRLTQSIIDGVAVTRVHDRTLDFANRVCQRSCYFRDSLKKKNKKRLDGITAAKPGNKARRPSSPLLPSSLRLRRRSRLETNFFSSLPQLSSPSTAQSYRKHAGIIQLVIVGPASLGLKRRKEGESVTLSQAMPTTEPPTAISAQELHETLLKANVIGNGRGAGRFGEESHPTSPGWVRAAESHGQPTNSQEHELVEKAFTAVSKPGF